MISNRVLALAALLVALLVPTQLLAAWTAITRADLNLRVGPSTSYGVINVIPAGQPVDVIGCIAGLQWCDVEWLGLRGFVAAHYLVQPGTSMYLPQYAPTVGVPIITFSFGTYHDRYYRDRPWYRERYWGGHWRDHDDKYVIIKKPKRRDYRVEEPEPREYRVEEPEQTRVLEPHERGERHGGSSRRYEVPETGRVPVWGQ